ncbi:STAS domain-containing protein [Deefgea sp. CFH1-16]|uniref:STAS domain-containing protein n=1 Tax=Deefgea sp. CFH1-16 TaxID=2675457 RepID=UPI0015F4A4DF|nr:STAS domain-containing protein [Deefgea sp. CFH1-16]MBM5573998.1 STAS domain-containing protein [Deefgea sp. CFH1-16]
MTELILNGEQTIYQVRDTYQQLKSIMNESKGLSLFLPQIQECDCTFVQLLLWVKQEAERQQQPLQLLQPTAELVELVSLLGLSDELFAANQEMPNG